ncbi:DUF6192 family protein [Streptomyces sp. NPDC127117]|uniref:DUF6192 family protein n=1 Tax=Streptomyces sp. NPDC127117 TaxID=3345368 RepID=UPI0036428AFC
MTSSSPRPSPRPTAKPAGRPDDASRRVRHQVENPVTPQEKISAIHTLAQDNHVAAAVTSDFLKRPEVTAEATAVDKARVVEECQTGLC